MISPQLLRSIIERRFGGFRVAQRLLERRQLLLGLGHSRRGLPDAGAQPREFGLACFHA